MKLSVVVPVYMAERLVNVLVSRLTKSLAEITEDYEIILVEDGSPDNSWESIKVECSVDNRIRGVKLSRNFGQHAAIFAGLKESTGDVVCVMDCDLQDPPEEIPSLMNKLHPDIDVVLARRLNRKTSFIKRLTSRFFYFIFRIISGSKRDGSVGNFGLYRRQVIDELVNISEVNKTFSMLVDWVGFKKNYYDFQQADRFEGKTSYTWRKLFNLALEIAISYSDKPLRFSIKLGLSISILALCFGIYTITMYAQGNIAVPGYASLIISIWFLSGLILFMLGVVGLYVGRNHETLKGRPNYIVKKKINTK